jgi:hypothetical protein
MYRSTGANPATFHKMGRESHVLAERIPSFFKQDVSYWCNDPYQIMLTCKFEGQDYQLTCAQQYLIGEGEQEDEHTASFLAHTASNLIVVSAQNSEVANSNKLASFQQLC